MAMVEIEVLRPFYYQRDQRAEYFVPSTYPDGSPHLHLFQEHQAQNIVNRGEGRIHDRGSPQAIQIDDPVLKAAYEERLAQIAKQQEDQAATMAEGMVAFKAPSSDPIVVQAASGPALTPAAGKGRKFKAA